MIAQIFLSVFGYTNIIFADCNEVIQEKDNVCCNKKREHFCPTKRNK